jgi:hypothetical protein
MHEEKKRATNPNQKAHWSILCQQH